MRPVRAVLSAAPVAGLISRSRRGPLVVCALALVKLFVDILTEIIIKQSPSTVERGARELQSSYPSAGRVHGTCELGSPL